MADREKKPILPLLFSLRKKKGGLDIFRTEGKRK